MAYILEIPEVPGPTQTEFEIKKEASYIVSVKNPEIVIPGYDVYFLKKIEEENPIIQNILETNLEKIGDG